MKYFIGASALTVLCLFVLLFYQFGLAEKEIPFDDEQQGLKNQIIIHFSHVVAENTPKGLAAQKFANLVNDKSNGRMKVVVYPNSILYSDGQELKALQNGNVQMIAPSFSKLAELNSHEQVLDLPFLFRNDNHVKAVFTGKVGNQILETMQTPHIKGMALWSNGFKQLTHQKKYLITPKDFANQRIRIQPSKVIEYQFKQLGAKPVPLSFNDVYRSLETHDINGTENTISNIYSKKYYKVQKYMTLSNHGILGYAVLMNQSFWKKLQPKDQKILRDAMNETTEWNLNQSREMNKVQLAKIKESGEMKIHVLSETEKKRWKKVFEPVYKQTSKIVGRNLIKRIENAE
jgi:tripartite ATP-independent transporter DctP family solute receptor